MKLWKVLDDRLEHIDGCPMTNGWHKTNANHWKSSISNDAPTVDSNSCTRLALSDTCLALFKRDAAVGHYKHRAFMNHSGPDWPKQVQIVCCHPSFVLPRDLPKELAKRITSRNLGHEYIPVGCAKDGA